MIKEVRAIRRESKILIVSGVLAVGVVLGLLLYVNGGEDEVMSADEAARRVRELKDRVKTPLEEETRRRITELTNDFSKEFDFREVDGENVSFISAAAWELRKIGVPSLPQLIDAVQSDGDVMIRQNALWAVYKICLDAGRDPMEFLPLFVLSMSDGEENVRATGVSCIGEMARECFRSKHREELSQLIPYLVKALSDESHNLQDFTGLFLFNLGREDLLPKALLNKHKDPRSGYVP